MIDQLDCSYMFTGLSPNAPYMNSHSVIFYCMILLAVFKKLSYHDFNHDMDIWHDFNHAIGIFSGNNFS